MTKGILFIISAPSGTGKSTLIRSFLYKKPFYNIRISISYTTRNMRPGEINGKHYYFVSKYKFLRMIKGEKFLEYAKVFNNYYGTSYKLIYKFLSQGIDIFLDIDWQGAKKIKSKIPESRSIFIFPPSKNELYHRLLKRGQNSDKDILERMKNAVFEMQHYIEYDYLIINDNFELAISDLESIILSARLSTYYQTYKYINLIKKLLDK